jgi:hypothetical protein
MGNAIKSPNLILADRRRKTERGQIRRRIFYITRAMNRAKNPEWKDLWKRKKEELEKNL